MATDGIIDRIGHCIGTACKAISQSVRTNKYGAGEAQTLMDMLSSCSTADLKVMEAVTGGQGHDEHYAIEDYKIQRELRFKPTTSLGPSLELIVPRYLKQIEFCKHEIQPDGFRDEHMECLIVAKSMVRQQ